MVDMTLSRVDLPLPEGPIIQMNSPSTISRLIPFKASTFCSSYKP